MDVKKNGTWQQIRNVLFEALTVSNGQIRATRNGSSQRAAAEANTDKILKLMKAHADIRLKTINNSAAARATLGKLKDGSTRAKRESDRITNAIASVAKVTNLVNDLGNLVRTFSDIVS